LIPLDALSYLGIFVRRNWLLPALLISGLACAPGATRTTQSPLAASTGPSSQPLLPALRIAADSFLALSESQQSEGLWPDLSDETRLSGEARLDRIAVWLRAIDHDRLSPSDELLYDNLRESVDASVASRVCRTELWAITNQFTGWHVAASNLARVQSVGSDDARSTALTVFRALPAVIAAERAMLERGLDSGYTASRAVTAVVVRQYDDLLPSDPERSPLYAPAVRDSTLAFRAAWRALLADSIYPAARAEQSFLREVYLPHARAEGSLSALPNGVECYAASLRQQTSMRADVDSIMRSARRDVDRITARLAPLVLDLTGERDVARGVIRLRSDPQFTFASRDSVLAAYRAMTTRAATLIGKVVAEFGPEPLVVTPYPDFQERAGLPPQYLRASDDESRPAQFMVNLSRTERMSVADAVAHEAYPGHHLQRIAERRGAVVHPVMRTLFFGGFIEGWGIYSEQLAEEMGLFQTPLDRVGYLVHLLDVAVAAYLDVGYHTRGWSRQNLVDTMIVVGGRPKAMAEAYADRHAATPGQLATYYIGYEAIRSDRERAQRALGGRFQSPAFHREVLKDGTVTLASLGAKVDRWIAERRR
jgi:uncharacterized protein (DUF885 family)